MGQEAILKQELTSVTRNNLTLTLTLTLTSP